MQTIVVEVEPGSFFPTVCREMVQRAVQEDCAVQFRFNGVDLTATPVDTPGTLAEAYNLGMEEIRNSPEGQRRARLAEEGIRRAENERRILQERMPELLDQMDDVLASDNLLALIRWLRDFSASLDSGAKCDRKNVLDGFRRAGVVDLVPDHLDGASRKRSDMDAKDYAQDILWNVVKSLLDGHDIHPVCMSFCDGFFELAKKEGDSAPTRISTLFLP